jgi:hypothetical protein
MRKLLLISGIFLLTGIIYFSVNIYSQEKLSKHLDPFQPFVGKTWKGEFTDTQTGRKVTDVSRWERALNGNAVRILHSLNEGEYGGETIIIRDTKKEKLVFYYFTTEGFYTTGAIEFKEKTFTGHEVVTGNTNGITEVRSSGKILPDGRMYSKSQYLQNGEWVDGHEIFYKEDPQAKVIFK